MLTNVVEIHFWNYLSSDINRITIIEKKRVIHERANRVSLAEDREDTEIARNLLDLLKDKIILVKTRFQLYFGIVIVYIIQKLRKENL